MRQRLAQLLSLGACVLLTALSLLSEPAFSARPAMQPAASRPSEDPAGARVIVKFRSQGALMRALRASGLAARGPRLAATLGVRHGLSLSDGLAIQANMQVVRGDRSMSSAALAAQLAADPDVELAVPDYRRYPLAAPNDPLYAANPNLPLPGVAAGQWYLRAPDSDFISAINAEAAWSVTTGSASIVVADLDTGIRPDHPDLVNKLFAPTSADRQAGFTGPFVGWDFISDVATANDGNGRDPDASDPGDWTTNNECGSGQTAESSSWHGTQTAGVIGAQTGNGVGMASVGHDVMIMPLRVLGRCGGSDSDIQAAMLWAAGIAVPGVPANPHPAKVINMSLGGSGSCTGTSYPGVISQVTAAGVTIVVAAGNAEGQAVSAPGDCAGVITVAAVRNVGTKVGFSSIGPEVAISAPGGNCINLNGACLDPILTTTNSGTTTPATNGYSDSDNPSLGTSFSTPQVAGTVALMLSANAALTPSQVLTILQATARPFPTLSAGATTSVPQCQAPGTQTQDECLCTTTTCGAGLLDAEAAVVSAAGLPSEPPLPIVAASTLTPQGITATLDGSASSRSVVQYAWSLAPNAPATLSSPTDQPTVVVTPTGTGDIGVTLTVTDAQGQQASTVTTLNGSGLPPTVVISGPGGVLAGNSFTLDGSGSYSGAGLSIAAYQWSIGTGAAYATINGSSTDPSVNVTTTGNAKGSIVVDLTVTDSQGVQGSGSQTVSVTPVTPTPRITASATSVTEGASVSFDGSGSTAPTGRTITAYQWSITAGSSIAAFTGSTTGSTATVSTSGSGNFSVQLMVTDSAGATAVSSASVVVNAPAASGGGGGGAMSPLWVLGVAVAAFALHRTRRRPD